MCANHIINKTELNTTKQKTLEEKKIQPISDASFQLAPDEPELPFTQIPNDLIRDTSISPECRWLIIFLLSNKEGWQIKMSQIINHLKGQMGREAVYKLRKEALESGYMYCHEYYENNLRRCKYYVSRTPRFKKILRRPENQDVGKRDPENQQIKEHYKEKHHKKNPPPPSPKSKPKEVIKKNPNFGKVSLRSEEEDSFVKTEKEWPSAKPLYDIGLTTKQVLRIVKKYRPEQVLEALEIFKTQEVKKDAMGLLLNILENPDKWDKKQKIKTKEEKDKEAEEYIAKNKQLAVNMSEMYKGKIRIFGDLVRLTYWDERYDIFYWQENFEEILKGHIRNLE